MMKNKKCIFFVISNNYVFAFANVLISLKKYSNNLLDHCDIILYHDGISLENRNLLRKLCNNIRFEEIYFHSKFDNILDFVKSKKWNIYIVVKFFGFDLVKRYEKVLFLDADVLIKQDISSIFEIKEEMAWRKVIGWNTVERLSSVLENKNDYISVGNGGVIYFTNKINKYNINDDDIVLAFEKLKNLKISGIDEIILAYIAYKKRIKLKELDISFNCSAAFYTPDENENLRINNFLKSRNAFTEFENINKNVKIIHFLNSRGITTKPWENLASYLYFREWAENYEEWISMGGSGLVSFTEEDYYNLFGFKQADEIKKLKNKLKQKDEELEKLKNISRKYNIISNSKTWKATKPIRKIFDIIKKLK